MPTDLHTPPTTPQVAPTRAPTAVTRRNVLRVVGLGSGLVAVVAATGLTWRAVDGGVFATGTGPAYDAWDQATPGGQPLNMVSAAILAANAHNTQPWLFTVAEDRIELFADLSRTIGTMDPLLRELHLSLGCAIENLALAGPPNAMTATVTLLPDDADPTHIASVALTPAPVTASPLFDAITQRHTSRGAYDTTRTVNNRRFDALRALAVTAGTDLVWFTTPAQKQAFSDLTVRATESIIADHQQAADDYRWYRSSWQDLQHHKDGITIDPSGQSELIRAVSKLIPTTQQQNNDGWLSGTRDTQLPTAAAFGALTVTDRGNRAQLLQAGRIWQRMHLSATIAGLALQPLCQICERADRESSAGLHPEFTDAMAAMLPAGTNAVMTFRIGYPVEPSLASPRRPAADVIHA
jgi:nitroreductase